MTMTVDRVLKTISESQAEFAYRDVDVRTLLVAEGSLVTPDGDLGVDERGRDIICKQVGAPSAYLEKISPRLRTALLQEHLERGHAGSQVRLFHHAERLVGLGRTDLAHLDGHDVLLEVCAGAELDRHPNHVDSFQFSEAGMRFELDIVLDERAHDVGTEKSDILNAGIHVSYDLLGRTATEVKPFILRLICTNGLVVRECEHQQLSRTRRLSRHHAGAEQLYRDQIRQLARQAVEGIERRAEALRRLQDEHVDQPRQALDLMLRRARLPRTLLDRLMHAWETEGGEDSAYRLLNAITHVATHQREHLDRRQLLGLSRLAGQMAGAPLGRCPTCHALVAPHTN